MESVSVKLVTTRGQIALVFHVDQDVVSVVLSAINFVASNAQSTLKIKTKTELVLAPRTLS